MVMRTKKKGNEEWFNCYKFLVMQDEVVQHGVYSKNSFYS
jgi:hypothetical protein